jgi:hypothetical protein
MCLNLAPVGRSRILAAALTVVVAVFAHAVRTCAGSGSVDAKLTEVLIPGAPDRGIFDPSITTDGSGRLFMSVSGIGSTAEGSSIGANAVRTYLAVSDDQGSSWRLAGLLNPEIEVRLDTAAAPRRGRWQSEVSALVHDAEAPRAARWKLFWHQYLNVNGDRKFQHGWIAYKEAETAEGLAAATPIKLITALGYDPVNDQAAGWTHASISGPAVVRVQDLAPDLAHCAAVSEPGVLDKPDGLYFSLVCYRGSLFGLFGVSTRVILLRCARPCTPTRPGAWSYAGTVLTEDDAKGAGMNKFSASDLFSESSRDFVAVSPVGTVPGKGAYKGCIVYRLADLSKAKIARESDARPHAEAKIGLDRDSFNGACTFLPTGANKGLLIGRVDFAKRQNVVEPTFRVFMTGVVP